MNITPENVSKKTHLESRSLLEISLNCDVFMVLGIHCLYSFGIFLAE